MYELKLYNEYATIYRRYKKTEYLKMKRYATKLCKEQNMKFSFTYLKEGQ